MTEEKTKLVTQIVNRYSARYKAATQLSKRALELAYEEFYNLGKTNSGEEAEFSKFIDMATDEVLSEVYKSIDQLPN